MFSRGGYLNLVMEEKREKKEGGGQGSGVRDTSSFVWLQQPWECKQRLG
jgi:hypothetical protein